MKNEIIDIISRRLNGSFDRFLLGICGAPGSGKSTLARWIVSEWSILHPGQAVILPMDGYHFSNEELKAMGLLALKGIPETFDSHSFLQKLQEVKANPASKHACPRFDRSIEASIQDDIKILPEHRLIVVEGNYLLLDTPPWISVRNTLDETWFIDSDEKLIYPRLLARHMKGGKNEKAAAEKVASTDLPNARLVANSKAHATRAFKATDLDLPPLPETP